MDMKVVSTVVVRDASHWRLCGSGPQPPRRLSPPTGAGGLDSGCSPITARSSDRTAAASAALAGTATVIEPGIGECDLVRLKGKTPTDVLVGEGKGTREVQVLYSEAGGRELYFFVNNRLDRVVK